MRFEMIIRNNFISKASYRMKKINTTLRKNGTHGNKIVTSGN